MSSFLEQAWTLTYKNLLIILIRPWRTTPLRALILPVAFVIFLTYARDLFNPPSRYGIGHASPVLPLTEAVKLSGNGRNKLALVNSGHTNGDIARVISKLESTAQGAGLETAVFTKEESLTEYCRTSLRGASHCYGAVVFTSSPKEAFNGSHVWNYTIRADGVLGKVLEVARDDNEAQTYTLPLQHAVDREIDALYGGSRLPNKVYQIPYTSLTETERKDDILATYMNTMVKYLSVGVLLGIIGVGYQLTGLIAAERELGMSQLIDCMLPNRSPLAAQLLRLLSAHVALDIVYGPAWIFNALILKYGIYRWSNVGIIIGVHILGGLALSSFSVFFAAFFRKSQMSGITTVIICIVLGIIAQLLDVSSNGTAIILSLLFPPMNFVLSMIWIARWEKEEMVTDLTRAAPGSDWTVKGYVLWIFLIIQIIVYPLLAVLVERVFYDTQSSGRKETKNGTTHTAAVKLQNFTKDYQPSWFKRTIGVRFGSKRRTVRAVDGMTLDVMMGEIMVLLGANGSGKSTTLTAIAGLSKISGGEISLNYAPYSGGFGLCPQYNVLWDRLTVQEHVRIFSRLKSSRKAVSAQEIDQLIEDCDLGKKKTARSQNLSGGQKRKLQLAMMFVGGSSICCVDEVSSGIDPISRTKIWDILLAERGKRTILLTTHFLDEADVLADHIAIMHRGELKAHGSGVDLKNNLGSGYRLHVFHPPGSASPPTIPGLESCLIERQFNELVYALDSGSAIAEVVNALEEQGVKDYGVSPPTIEDVFLKVAQDPSTIQTSPELKNDDIFAGQAVTSNSDAGLSLADGKPISMLQQAKILFLKRCIVLRRSWFPTLVAVAIPIIAAGAVTLYLDNMEVQQCGQASEYSSVRAGAAFEDFSGLLGPADAFTPQHLNLFAQVIAPTAPANMSSNVTKLVASRVLPASDYRGFIRALDTNHSDITPGGLYLGDATDEPTFAWRGDGKYRSVMYSLATQNLLDSQLMQRQVLTQFQAFDIPRSPDMGNALQLIAYTTLVMACYPAFLALYPTFERTQSIRAMHYSNGVRGLSLWLAYLAFDSIVILFASVVVIIIWVARSDAWFAPGYLFVVLYLYGIASVLLAYLVSMFATSQLAAFAFAAGKQAIFFLLYMIAYFCILTYAPIDNIDSDITIVHFTLSLISPICNLTRSMLLTLNLFSLVCEGKHKVSYPGKLKAFGGPILYLVLQCFALFGLLLWWDSGFVLPWKRERDAIDDDEKLVDAHGGFLDGEAQSLMSGGLRVSHLDKRFGSFVAVEDVSFAVPVGEVFALLGPNGAGKSTTIGLIRGDLKPSSKHSDVFVKDVSIIRHRAKAQQNLGVCPQFDAMDQMTVVEQLRFYARIRGIPDVDRNVEDIILAVGLDRFRDILAAKLSGGNKRKLSLGIALMGNPSVLLLDEPSSGMDAAAKRVMWRTLAAITPGRSLILTTHSMEEADALATRAGIISKRMLEIGTTEQLRRQYGNVHHVHLIHQDAPHTRDEDMRRIVDWIHWALPGAQMEQKTYHGQIRFTVPAASEDGKSVTMPTPSMDDSLIKRPRRTSAAATTDNLDGSSDSGDVATDWAESTLLNNRTRSTIDAAMTIGALFSLLEAEKARLGIENYSVSQTSLDQVFLAIVGKQFDENA